MVCEVACLWVCCTSDDTPVHEIQRARRTRSRLGVHEIAALLRPSRPPIYQRSLDEHFTYDSMEELFRFLRTRPSKERFSASLKCRTGHDGMWTRWLEFLDYVEKIRRTKISPDNVVTEVESWVDDRVHSKKGYSGNERCCNGTIAKWTREIAKVWCTFHGARYVSNDVTFPGSNWTFEKLIRSLPAYRHKLPKFWLREKVLRPVYRDYFPGGLAQWTLDRCSLDQLVVLALVLSYFGWFRMSEIVRCDQPGDSDLGVAHGGLFWRDFRREVLCDFQDDADPSGAVPGLLGWLSWFKNKPVKPGQKVRSQFYLPLFDDPDDFSPKPILALLADCEISGHTGEVLRVDENRPVLPDPANPGQNISKRFVDARVRVILKKYIPRVFWPNISTHGPRGGRAQDARALNPPMPFPMICQAGRWGSEEALQAYLANDILTVFRWTSMLPSQHA